MSLSKPITLGIRFFNAFATYGDFFACLIKPEGTLIFKVEVMLFLSLDYTLKSLALKIDSFFLLETVFFS